MIRISDICCVGGSLACWSYRVGIYRIIYERRDDRTVRAIAIRHRGSADDIDPR